MAHSRPDETGWLEIEPLEQIHKRAIRPSNRCPRVPPRLIADVITCKLDVREVAARQPQTETTRWRGAAN